jgi:hypothetical protein
MTASFTPLINLRNSLQAYLKNPKQRSGKLYWQTIDALNDMHDAMADYMLSTKDNSILQRYMRTWQEQIRLTFDDIPIEWAERIDDEDPSDRHSNICYECFRLIKEMQLQYPAFFDNTCISPIMYKHLEKSSVFYQWQAIQDQGKNEKWLSRSIWKMISAYQDRIWNPTYRASYSEIAYACNFIRQLRYNLQNSKEKFSLASIYSFLFHLNFNDTVFYRRLIEDMAGELDELLLANEKKTMLEQFQTQFSSALVRLDCTLDPGNPPIHTMVNNWINKELVMLET